MVDIKEYYFYRGNFYHRDQLLRFKSAKKQKDVYIYKARGYNEKRNWYLWDVIVETKFMKMFYDNNEFTFYVYNEKSKTYTYWMTANTLRYSIINVEHKSEIEKTDSSIETTSTEPTVYIEICFTDESEESIKSYPIYTSE